MLPTQSSIFNTTDSLEMALLLQRIESFQRFSRLAAGVILSLGLAVLAGWAFDVAILKSVAPGLAAMKPMTAAGFVFAGASLWLLQPDQAESKRRAGRLLAVLACVLGVAVLVEYLLGRDLGLDLLLFPRSVVEEAQQTGLAHAGRMSPASAAMFVVLGAALMLTRFRTLAALTDGLCLAGALIAMAALSGYLLDIASLYRFGPYDSTAAHTAAAALLLASGIVSMYPDQGLMRIITGEDIGSVMARRILPAIIIVPWMLAWFRWRGELAGVYSASIGLVLFATSVIIVFAMIILWTATRLNRAEVARRATERRFRDLVETAPDAMVVVNAGGEILLVNSQATALFGWTREELLGQTVEILIPETRRRKHEGLRGEYFAQPRARPMGVGRELVARRKDGSEFQVEISLSPLRNHRGPLAISAIRDISERKRMERLRATQYAVAQVLTGATTFEEASPRLIEAVATHLGFQIGMLWEVDAGRDVLRLSSAWQSDAPGLRELIEAARLLKIPRGLGIAGRAWERGTPIWVRDALELPSLSDAPRDIASTFEAAGLHAAAAFPIVLRGQVRGIIDFLSANVLDPDPDVLNMFSTIATQIGQFMERRAQELNILRLNRIYALLSGINSAVVRVRERETLFEEACRIAIAEGGFAFAWVGIVEPESQTIVPTVLRGPAEDVALLRSMRFSTRADIAEGRTKMGATVRTRMPAYANDLSAYSRDPALDPVVRRALEELVKRGYRSAISLPLIANGIATGVMVLYMKEPVGIDSEELKLLSELAEDISFALEHIEREERINFMAYHDSLTGLPNRANLRRRLAQDMDRAATRNLPMALLLININNFRDINDSLGHQNGDALLREVARRMSAALWGSDVVASLGGDDYAILLSRLAQQADIYVVIRKIAETLRAPFDIAGLPINVESSIGIALYPDHGNTPDLLWQHADVALRKAQETRQAHLLYSADFDHYDPKWLALVGGLQDAIAHNELTLHYQPKINFKSGCTDGAEALLRWRHPKLGMLHPDAFVPLVERTGLIDPLTTWVLGEALRQGRLWHLAGVALELAVNLSALNLQNPGLSAEIIGLAHGTQFPRERLIVEITESAIMVDPAKARAVLNELHAAGVRCAMDDFGTGQSSLTYLKDLPISEMKIDKSFIIGHREPHNAAIVHSAIELAHNLNLTVTAEGVEDAETFEWLSRLGCDYAQGYYFSRALPADDFLAWVRNSQWKSAG